MGKKKEPSVQDAVKLFKDVAHRATLTDYLMVNGKFVSKNTKEQNIIIAPESNIYKAITEDEELSKSIKELDISNPAEYAMQNLFQFADDVDSSEWIELNAESLFKGDVIKISIANHFEYEIPVNRNLLPLKLRKSEYSDIYYRVFIRQNIRGAEDSTPIVEMGIKKKFTFPIDGCNFSIIRMFKVV